MTATPRMEGGFSLVEVALALGVTAFCLLAVFGLLPIGVTSNQQASQETEAIGVLSAVILDLQSTPVTSPRGRQATSHQYGIPLPANPVAQLVETNRYFGDSQDGEPQVNSDSRYLVRVTFLPNSNSRAATLARVDVLWPPAAASPTGKASALVALDRN